MYVQAIGLMMTSPVFPSPPFCLSQLHLNYPMTVFPECHKLPYPWPSIKAHGPCSALSLPATTKIWAFGEGLLTYMSGACAGMLARESTCGLSLWYSRLRVLDFSHVTQGSRHKGSIKWGRNSITFDDNLKRYTASLPHILLVQVFRNPPRSKESKHRPTIWSEGGRVISWRGMWARRHCCAIFGK